jgi:predicted ATPase
MLNGSTIRMGTVSDIVDKVHGRRSFRLRVASSSSSYTWTFSGERADMSMGVESVDVDGQTFTAPQHLHYLLPQGLSVEQPPLIGCIYTMTYITAERVGPREVYPLEDSQATFVVGPAGEHAVSVLYSGRDEQVLEALSLPGVPSTRLRQVEAHMKVFFPGCSLSLQQVPQANALTLGLRTSEDTDYHRPTHVGFGLTQVLPIIIAALCAKPEDMLLIENPEVHLHPAGQSLMGQFLAEVANAGVQVIIETHSDHILNGIRRAVKTEKLASEDVAIHFFQPRSQQNPQVISPTINDEGDIDTWPEGFFDQFDRDANYFAGWGE